jgi:hypothetical protein
MLTFISNIRNVSASGSVRPQGFPLSQGFQSSNGLSNLLDDYNWVAQGTAAVAGTPVSASASASQTSKLSTSAISMKGKLEVQSAIDPQGYGTANSLAASNFEVSFKLDVATNFTLTGQCSFTSRDHTSERRNFSITANGVTVATLNDLHGTPKALPLPVGTITIVFDTQVGAQTDPLGDSGTYIYSFSLVSS